MRCMKCGCDNDNDSNYCKSCGKQLHNTCPDEIIERNCCPRCGNLIYNNADFCGICGLQLNEVAFNVSYPTACVGGIVQPPGGYVGYYRPNQYKRVCPRCGGSNYHAIAQQVMVGSNKIKTRYTLNLNPLRPFTVLNKKEKVKKTPYTANVSRLICDDCGMIFR